ncbi:MAG: hypothetical protein IJW57_03385 [Spirochaetaceae bacterium]|nr:hypothetical protein [Spirochaetaceae bacterium]
MSSHPDTLHPGTIWYAQEGVDNDVVLSTRIRLARNLANFVFPCQCSADDVQRIQSLVFSAFQKVPNPDCFQQVGVDQLDFSARQLLVERGILPERSYTERNINNPDAELLRTFECVPGVVVRTDGRLSCLVNGRDHVSISSFSAGYNPGESWHLCREIDQILQQSLQFAASYDFGFLTSNLKDAGSGMKASVRLFLPGLMQTQQVQQMMEQVSRQNCILEPVFGNTSVPYAALGACYQLCSLYASSGGEDQQLGEFDMVVSSLCASERQARSNYAETRPTMLRHIISRMFSVMRYSRFIECSEALDIICSLHFGISMGLIMGVTYRELHALMYRVRNTHLDYLYRDGGLDFTFEADVVEHKPLVISRLRALLLQEALEKVQICL